MSNANETVLTPEQIFKIYEQSHIPARRPVYETNGFTGEEEQHWEETTQFAVLHFARYIEQAVLATQGTIANDAALGADAVAYLDIGAGGYIDVGSDLSDDKLSKLPKGRHMLGVIGTYGIDGYVPASQPSAQPIDTPVSYETLFAIGQELKISSNIVEQVLTHKLLASPQVAQKIDSSLCDVDAMNAAWSEYKGNREMTIDDSVLFAEGWQSGIATQVAQPSAEARACSYATALAMHLWTTFYKTDAPEWKPFPDLMGVLTQIDNMTTGLCKVTPPTVDQPQPSQPATGAQRSPETDPVPLWTYKALCALYAEATQIIVNLQAQLASAQPIEPEWINDPHDIEQGMMRNPKYRPQPSTTDSDVRDAALEEVAEAVWQYRAGEVLSMSLMQDIGQICYLIRALKSASAATDIDSVCNGCHGQGVVHTGLTESPTTQCKKCDGTGLPAATEASTVIKYPTFTKGQLYESKTHGTVRFEGMDTFHGETTYHFRSTTYQTDCYWLPRSLKIHLGEVAP